MLGFVVDRQYKTDSQFCGLPVVESEQLEAAHTPGSIELFVAVGYSGMNRARAKIYYALKQRGYGLASYISSRCTYLSGELPGDNCFILEQNIIQPFVKIGNNVVMWSLNHIGHDARIGDHCFITSKVTVAGFCVVDEYCFLGGNCMLRENITIGAQSLIGAGCVIMESTEPKSVYAAPRAIKLMRSSDIIQP